MALSLDSILSDKKRNNFNLLRLFMALAVLYNHSFVLFLSNGRQDVTNYIFNYFDSGSLAVCVFFLISGMLLAQSFELTKSRQKFIIKRVFRLFPALIICLLFTIFIIGPQATSLSLKEYFLSKGTYRYFYNVFLNNEVFIFNIPTCFTGNKVPDVINGSLWTLPYELVCYIFLFIVLSLAGYFASPSLSRNSKIFIACTVVYFGLYLLNGKYLLSRFIGLVTGFNENFVNGNNPVKLFIFFFTGVILYFLRRNIRLSSLLLGIPVLLLIIADFSNIWQLKLVLEFIVIVAGVLYFAGFEKMFKYNHPIDPSYGIYLYAWPVQQLFAYYFQLDAYISMLITLPIVALLGIISYKNIERPALDSVNAVHKFFS